MCPGKGHPNNPTVGVVRGLCRALEGALPSQEERRAGESSSAPKALSESHKTGNRLCFCSSLSIKEQKALALWAWNKVLCLLLHPIQSVWNRSKCHPAWHVVPMRTGERSCWHGAVTVSHHKPAGTGSRAGVMAEGDSQARCEAALSGVLLRVLCGNVRISRERGCVWNGHTFSTHSLCQRFSFDC